MKIFSFMFLGLFGCSEFVSIFYENSQVHVRENDADIAIEMSVLKDDGIDMQKILLDQGGGSQDGKIPMADMTTGGHQGGNIPITDMTTGGNQGGTMPIADMTVGGSQGGTIPIVDMTVGNDPPCGTTCPQLDMILIQNGSFMMGSDTNSDEQPIHQVNISSFFVSKTEVTVAQYKTCVDLRHCTEPNRGFTCNWGKDGYENHPVNCIDWNQARRFAKWIGGDLLTEAQWEYVAIGAGQLPLGQEYTYPWGNDEPSCQFANYSGCHNGTVPVCNTINGNTAQGVCDLGGNVWEWVLDEYHASYDNPPNATLDGQAWCIDIGICDMNVPNHVIRGDGWSGNFHDLHLRSADRQSSPTEDQLDNLGFRVAKISR